MNSITRDLVRLGNTPREILREGLLSPAMWAVASYRLRSSLYRPKLPKPIRFILNLFAAIIQVTVEAATHVTLPVTVKVGPGLYIAHTGYIVVGSESRIGSNCTLTHGVTIGHGSGGRTTREGCPTIGDRVYIGPGAILIGPIHIGDDVLIGAGAVVTRSVPSRGVVAGNPARLLSRRGSFGLIAYLGMESDPARISALAEAALEVGA